VIFVKICRCRAVMDISAITLKRTAKKGELAFSRSVVDCLESLILSNKWYEHRNAATNGERKIKKIVCTSYFTLQNMLLAYESMNFVIAESSSDCLSKQRICK
jgi:hypothetical protein